MAARHALLVAALLVVAGCHAPTADRPDPSTGETTATGAGTEAPTRTATPTVDDGGATGGSTTTVQSPTTPTQPPGAGPGQTQTPSPTPTRTPVPAAEYDIAVEDGELPVDANRTYARISLLLGTDVEPPARVRITDPEASSVSASLPPVLRALGVDFERRSEVAYAGLARSDEVLINRALLNDTADTESTLAHEYVHTVQYRTEVFGDVYGAFDSVGIDQALLVRAMIEGGATYTENVYSRRYLPDSPSAASELVGGYRGLNSSGYRFFVAPYRYGFRYLDERLASPRNLSVAYEDPPRTTEQLLYPSAGADPPATLSVSVREGDWRVSGGSERVGELGTRLVLRTELNRSAAARGADGWGEDRVYELERGTGTSYAWVLRWDDRANASEFRRAFATYLDRRGDRVGPGWYVPANESGRGETGDSGTGTAFRLVRPTDRTTVVFFGGPDFVADSEVTAASAGNVTIRTG